MKKSLFKGIALFGLALIVLIGFTGCPGTAGGGGDGTPPAPADKMYTVDGVGFTMKGIAAVNGGSSKIGDNTEGDNDKRSVRLSAYMIGETEVTQELWEAVMGSGNNPSWFDESTLRKRPVETVNWYRAIAFCNKLSLKLGLEPCYTVTVSGSEIDFETLQYSAIPTTDNADWNNAALNLAKNGFRLPTESEWEWAAKGGTEDKWAGTNTESELINYAWYNANADNKTHEVKLKSPNGYGLYDMTGNVWEWCHDWYESIAGGINLGPNYTGPPSGSDRVFRGGGSWSAAAGCSRSCRGSGIPGGKGSGLGLRLACRP